MLINSNTILKNDRLWLIPYLKEHVPQYHQWMKTEELLELTASEPLSLEEEYQMQDSWREDEDKCTFILFVAEKEELINESNDTTQIKGKIIGDVNLFLNDFEDKNSAEIEIMVAEKSYRGKGLGLLALLMMMEYGIYYLYNFIQPNYLLGVASLNLTRITSKIGESNTSSLKLFKEKLQFQQISYSTAFKEVTLELKANSESLRKLQSDLNVNSNYTVVELDTIKLKYDNFNP
ncbi:n-acetyltransferase 9-like protein [Neoconidiobolus thromboides FSU 785]|nr:n-acetyltransferase 9-like protein [Neoconidiobolus thromboides FSU 785]